MSRYDRPDIAEQYERTRRLPDATIDTWLVALSRLVAADGVSAIADVGCGTGRFTGPLARHFEARTYGIDPSEAMLERARAGVSTDVTFLAGPAEAIPLPTDSVDLAFLSMVYHHLGDRHRALDDLKRILRPGGALAIRTSTTDHLDTVPYLPHFPEARAINEARLPSIDGLHADVTSHGFEPAGHQAVRQTHADTPAAYLESIRARAHSDLVALDDAVFEAGLTRMTEAVTRAPAESVHETIDLLVFRVPH